MNAVDFAIRAYDEVTFSSWGTQALVEGNRVGMRGTEGDKIWKGGGMRDVITDAFIIPLYSFKLRGWFHGGVLIASNRLYKKIEAQLDKDQLVEISGHSLGGGLSVVIAGRLRKRGFKVRCITMGALRVCKRKTAAKLRKSGVEWFQYSNYGDPIPNVPWRITCWRHINEIPIGDPEAGYSLSRHNVEEYRELLTESIFKI